MLKENSTVHENEIFFRIFSSLSEENFEIFARNPESPVDVKLKIEANLIKMVPSLFEDHFKSFLKPISSLFEDNFKSFLRYFEVILGCSNATSVTQYLRSLYNNTY